MTSIYSLSIPGNSTIEFSKDELRSLLRETEIELHRSQAYRQALVSLQTLLGESSEQAKVLFKIVSREAISLVVRQFALYSQKMKDCHADVEVNNDVTAHKSDSNQELNSNLTSVNVDSQLSTENLRVQKSPVETQLNNDSSQDIISQDVKPKTKFNLFKWNQKISAAQAKEIADQKRLESLKQIGQQLRQARESQGLSLSQLSAYTHVPMYHMESIEEGYFKSLPDDVFVRGFIRVMGNTLGLDGNTLSKSLPNNQRNDLTLPPTYQPKQSLPSRQMGLELSPMHLYMGYTALVAGAVGGLSLMSGQSTTENKVFTHSAIPSTQSLTDSSRYRETNAKPGIQSNNGSVSVGIDIAPPEAL